MFKTRNFIDTYYMKLSSASGRCNVCILRCGPIFFHGGCVSLNDNVCFSVIETVTLQKSNFEFQREVYMIRFFWRVVQFETEVGKGTKTGHQGGECL